MEVDRLLSEDPHAFSCGSVKVEDAAVSDHSIHNDAKDLENEAVAPHGSLTYGESAESQKDRISVSHSPSKNQIHVRSINMAYLYGPVTYFS
jgi:hypothetical protein